MSHSTLPSSPPALAALDWRLLQPQDLPAMHALHLCSIEGMAAQTVKPETREFLHGLLLGRGRVIGAWHGAALAAYGVLQHDLLAQDDPRPLLGLAPGQVLYKLAGAAVAPAWRGQGLQRQLIARRVAWAGDAALFATAAPGNVPSWRSLLACGFAVRALQYRYGGHARYLLARVPGAALAHGAPARELAQDDIPGQEALLAQGWQGIAPGQAPGSLRLVAPAGGGQP